MGEPSGVEFQRVHPGLLKEIIVRPILPGERWEELMRQHHYLGFSRLVGESLRYVAERAGEWFALLGWHAAALKCRPRDRFIGWPPLLQYQRLHLIANNCRFLILPHAHLQNLASRVLSLNLRRLGADWQAVHGHRLLLAETFVDPQRFRGACYRPPTGGQPAATAKRQMRYTTHHPSGCSSIRFIPRPKSFCATHSLKMGVHPR